MTGYFWHGAARELDVQRAKAGYFAGCANQIREAMLTAFAGHAEQIRAAQLHEMAERAFAGGVRNP